MSERDFLLVSNLTKLRTAEELVRGALPQTAEQEARWREISSSVREWIEELEAALKAKATRGGGIKS